MTSKRARNIKRLSSYKQKFDTKTINKFVINIFITVDRKDLDAFSLDSN